MTDTPTEDELNDAINIVDKMLCVCVEDRPDIVAQAIATARREGAEKNFNHGYLIAVANSLNLHNDDVIASDVMSQETISMKEIEALGLADYDLDVLKELYRDYPNLGGTNNG